MPKPSIKFRTANPTFDEGQVFARYLDQAAEGFFRFMLGRRSVDIIATAFTQPGHDLSYQNVTFADDVSAGNKGARKVYEQRGMTVESQWPKRIPIPGMKFFRMVKEL